MNGLWLLSSPWLLASAWPCPQAQSGLLGSVWGGAGGWGLAGLQEHRDGRSGGRPRNQVLGRGRGCWGQVPQGQVVEAPAKPSGCLHPTEIPFVQRRTLTFGAQEDLGNIRPSFCVIAGGAGAQRDMWLAHRHSQLGACPGPEPGPLCSWFSAPAGHHAAFWGLRVSCSTGKV